MIKKYLIIILLIYPFYNFSQSGELLLQQYNKGPSLDNYYSKIEVFIGSDLLRINKNENTNPIINFGGNFELIYNITNTFGIKTGVNYFPIKYSYKNDENLKDIIKHIIIPIGLKLSPTKKSKFSMGINYNTIKKALYFNSNEKGEYDLSLYKNSFGLFIGYEYLIWKGLAAKIKYQFSKKNTTTKKIESEKNSGFVLTIKLRVLRTTIINK